MTGLLRAWRQGDVAARDAFLDLYAHLKRLAAAQLRSERAGHLLQVTDLVHETYLRLVGPTQPAPRLLELASSLRTSS